MRKKTKKKVFLVVKDLGFKPDTFIVISNQHYKFLMYSRIGSPSTSTPLK